MLKNLLSSIVNIAKATDSYDIRRYLAILFMAGGSIAMTTLVLLCIILIGAGHPGFLFWIACGAMILVGLQQTGFIALVAKREIEIEKNRISIRDSEEIKHQADQIKQQADEIKDVVSDSK